ncbi:UDP-glucose 4-epimerase [Lottiidibacillus patelloidae]|uniref:UDP-glucose 4-epimerase n=1 Tax=Lottiidibacillus patelloidae TaxID=2670334 RepID=A0A263BWS2_9BACI|nr:UDP-glucose 4-epimerase [Lottiidibacillus patelloidae]
MNVLITGGAGFIGSHLTSALLQENRCNVTIIDMLHSYYDVNRKKERLKYLKSLRNFTYHQIDLLNEEKLSEVFKQNTFDIVIHLAALPGVAYSVEKPNEYVDYDIKATINVLKFAGESQVKHVIFASSSSVYGDQANEPLSEEMFNGKVVSPYAAAKVGAESFCHAFHHIYNYDVTVLRFFTVYGPWGRPDMAIPLFIKRLLDGESITVFDQNTARDYTYIDDIINGISLALDKGNGYKVYNLGNGNPVSMKQLLATMKSYFPAMSIIEKGWRTGDVTSTWANITKAQRELGYLPTVSFEEGLAKTIEWAKQYYTNKTYN